VGVVYHVGVNLRNTPPLRNPLGKHLMPIREIGKFGKDVEATTKRIGGYLYKVVPIVDDAAGKVVNYTLTPLMVELRARDVMQIIIGASILAVPVGLTEEAWVLGSTMPMINVVGLMLVTLTFLASFIYYNLYRFNLRGHVFDFIKRVAVTYAVSLGVVGGLLLLIGKLGYQDGYDIAFARLVIVTFPSSMSAAVSDTIK